MCDTRTLQKCLRTLGSHWKLRVQTRNNWLRLVTPKACTNTINHLEGEGVPEQQGVSMENNPESDTDIEPVLQPCLSAVPCRMLQLSPDVDARARGMYAAVCH